MAQDVSDSETLFRLVPPSCVRSLPNGQFEITSSVFNTSELSALRLDKIDFDAARKADPKYARKDKSDYGIATFAASFVRQVIKCEIAIKPDDYPPDAHVCIYRDSSGSPLTRSQFKQLTASAQLLIPPNMP